MQIKKNVVSEDPIRIAFRYHVVFFLRLQQGFRQKDNHTRKNGNGRQTFSFIRQKDGCDDAADGGDHRACRSKDGGDCHDGQHRVGDVIQKRLDKPVLHLVFRQGKWNGADQIGRSGDDGEIEKIL